jgi:hypothetical protein
MSVNRALLALFAVLCVVAALFAAQADANKVCAKSDCSDIVGDGLVKDNLGSSRHFTGHHHDRLREEQRIKRIQMKKRGEL